MIFEVFNMYVMSTVRFYESICISVLICIDLRWIQCCSIQSVQSVLPFWKSLFHPFWKCLFQCSSEHSAVLFFVSALFLRLHLLRAKHNGKQLNPFAPRLGRRLGARGSPGQPGAVRGSCGFFRFHSWPFRNMCARLWCIFERYAKYWEVLGSIESI